MKENTYKQAQSAVLDRYRHLKKMNYLCVCIAAGSLLVAVISVSNNYKLAQKSTFVPYVVEVDSSYKQAMVKFLDPSNIQKNESLIRADLMNFVFNARTVYADSVAQDMSSQKVVQFLKPNSQAFNLIVEYYKQNPPVKRDETVYVNIKSINYISEKTYQIDWQEITTEASNLQTKKEMRATLTFEFVDPNKESVRNNPQGMKISNIDWQEVIE